MVELKGVTKSFDEVCPIKDLSYCFNNGSRVAITGVSGSGKTTFLRLISGLIKPDCGEIYIDNRLTDNSNKQVHPSQRNLGFVFQWPALWPHMTVCKNISYGLLHMNRKERLSRVCEIMELLEISDISDKYPDTISGGQAKRVSLARTLVVHPKHLLLDEPLSNLDEHLKERVIGVIDRIVTEYNMMLLYVTHDEMEASSICTEFCIIKDGSIFNKKMER